MKYLVLIYCFLLGCLVQANDLSNYDKSKAYPITELGIFGEQLSKAQSFYMINMDSVFFYLDQAKKAIDPTSELESVIYYRHKTVSLLSAQIIDSVEIYANIGLEIASKNNFKFYEFVFHQVLSVGIQDVEDQIYHSSKALDIAFQLGDKKVLFSALSRVITFEVMQDRIDQTPMYLTKMRELLNTMEMDINKPRPHEYIQYYLTVVEYYSVMEKVDENYKTIMSYQDSALYLAEKANLIPVIVDIVYSSACIAVEFKEYKRAIELFNIADQKKAILLGQKEIISGDDLFRAKAYMNLGNCKESRFYFERFLESEYLSIQSKKDVYYIGFKIYLGCDELKKSDEYLSQYLEEINIHNTELRDSLQVEYANKYHLHEIETENLLKTKEVEYQAYKNKIILLVSLCIIISIILMYLIRVKMYKKNLSLSNKLLKVEKGNAEFRKESIENITHEIKTPLTQIHGVLEVIQDKTTDEELLNLVQIGSRNSTQLKHDVDQILELMKSDFYKDSVHVMKTNLYSFFLDLIESNVVKVFSKGISIHLMHNLSRDSFADIDKEKISMIFLNYLTNSIKHSKGDCVNIEVKGSQSYLTFYIENNGSYISEVDQDRIFERYYQVNEDNVSGHGIGLSIVGEVSNVLGATVGVKSNKEDKITRFHFSIPVKVNNVLDSFVTKKIEFQSKTDQGEKGDYNKPKILIVDDNVMMIEFYREILKDSFDCDFSLDGFEALKKIKLNRYECIVSDILMPEMDGFELVDKIKASMEHEILTPIIFVTGGDHSSEIKYNALNAGVHDVISKPFVIKELIARIKYVIKNNILRKEALNEKVQELDPVSNTKIEIEKGLDSDTELLNRIIKYIDQNISDSNLAITELATSVFYSARQLNRKTAELTGLTPGKLILERRMLTAYAILRDNNSIRVSEVQVQVGIKSPGYFYTKFKARFGVSPSSVQNKA